MQPLRCPQERALGRRRRGQARSRDPHRPSRAGPRPLRARRPRVGGAVRRHGRQGPLGGGRRPRRALGRGRAPRREAARPSRSGARWTTHEDADRPRHGLPGEREDDAHPGAARGSRARGHRGDRERARRDRHRPRDPPARRRAHRPARVGLRVLHAPRRSRRRAPRPRRPEGDGRDPAVHAGRRRDDRSGRSRADPRDARLGAARPPPVRARLRRSPRSTRSTASAARSPSARSRRPTCSW